MNKGSSYEREVCKRLSLWWTQDEDPPRDDVFWRTSQSGGRATSRAKKGSKTKNSHGDVCAIDPVGQPLLDLITIEVKRGYSSSSIQDLLDKGPKAAKQTYEKWIEKAVQDHKQAGSFSWMIIVKRDKRDPLVILPNELEVALPIASARPLAMVYGARKSGSERPLWLMPLEEWLEIVTPRNVRDSWNWFQSGGA